MKEANEIYYRLNDEQKELINNISEITLTDYESLGDFIEIEKIWNIIEDLKCSYGNLEEKYEDLVRDVEDNYRPIPYDEQI